MALRIVIVGPGRVGVALARRFATKRVAVCGFVGRDATRTAAAVQAAGVGDVLQFADLPRAHVVLFTVGDDDLRSAIQQAVAAATPRACSLWVHTSGRHDLSLFDGVVGIRRGVLHPAVPVVDGPGGAAGLVGAPGVYHGDANARHLLALLCEFADLTPIEAAAGDRVLYHAACALAANGLTALVDVVQRTFARSGVVADASASALGAALMQAALRNCHEHGAAAALTGPVRRGDAVTVALHRAHLQAALPQVLPIYDALSQVALALARADLPADRAAAVAAALRGS